MASELSEPSNSFDILTPAISVDERTLESEICTISVGEEEVNLNAHLAILKHSPVLATLLKHKQTTNQAIRIVFPYQSSPVLRGILQYLYSQELPLRTSDTAQQVEQLCETYTTAGDLEVQDVWVNQWVGSCHANRGGFQLDFVENPDTLGSAVPLVEAFSWVVAEKNSRVATWGLQGMSKCFPDVNLLPRREPQYFGLCHLLLLKYSANEYSGEILQRTINRLCNNGSYKALIQNRPLTLMKPSP